MNMNVTFTFAVLCVVCAVAGCTRREKAPDLQLPTLDEAIDALPDTWGFWSAGEPACYTNKYAVLKQVSALTNVKERIRLTRKLINHFRHTPEWYVEHLDGGFRKSQRHDFFGNCAWPLIFGTNATPETVIAGWEIEAETLRDMEAVIRLTGTKWQDTMRKRHEARIEDDLKNKGIASGYSPELVFAAEIRRRYYFFFLSFGGDASYRKLPDDMKPAFIEQMKRDFFIYSDVTNAFTWKTFPPELKEAYLEVRRQIEEK